MTNWKVVTDNDGKQRLQVNANVVIPNVSPGSSFLAIPVASGDSEPPKPYTNPLIADAIAQTTAYTVDQLMELRNQQWKLANPSLVGRYAPPGVHEPPPPEPPAGRFQNLDFDGE